jgi:polysaccharide export outer membrane protein
MKTLLVGLLCAASVLAARPLASQSAGNYIIGAQDVLAITVLDDPTLNGRYTVEADGEFTFPLIGRIKAAGLSTKDFETALKKRLSPDFIKNPQLSVSVETYRSQFVVVSGEVRAPSSLPLTGGMTLAEALAKAGSTTPAASGDVAIIRKGMKEPINISIRDLQSGVLTQNPELTDGDQVYVLRAESLYIFGEVKTPGAYVVQPNTTVLQALALAGGATPNGALNRIKIVRMKDGKRTEMDKVKLTEIVLAGDTIIVPERYF